MKITKRKDKMKIILDTDEEIALFFMNIGFNGYTSNILFTKLVKNFDTGWKKEDKIKFYHFYNKVYGQKSNCFYEMDSYFIYKYKASPIEYLRDRFTLEQI